MFTNSARTHSTQSCDSRLASLGMKSGAILGALSLTVFGAVALASPASASEGGDSHSSGSEGHSSDSGSHSSDSGSHSSDSGSGDSGSHSSDSHAPDAPHADGGTPDAPHTDGGTPDAPQSGGDSSGGDSSGGDSSGGDSSGGGSDDSQAGDDDTMTVTADAPLSKVICDDGKTLTLSVVGHGSATYEQEEGDAAHGLAEATAKAQAQADKDAAKQLKAKQALHAGSTAGACVIPPVVIDVPVDTTSGPISQAPADLPTLTNVAAAATVPTAVNIPAAATTAGANPASVSVPQAATIPTAVPSGDGSSAPGSDFPVWGIAMMVVAALAAAGAGTKALASNNR